MQPERFVTCGLVLRETDTRDADKILTVLTPDRGRLSVIARGARRKGSRVAAACQLLAYSEMTLYEKGRWTMLDAADTIELFDGLRQDLTALRLAALFARPSPRLPRKARRSGQPERGRRKAAQRPVCPQRPEKAASAGEARVPVPADGPGRL